MAVTALSSNSSNCARNSIWPSAALIPKNSKKKKQNNKQCRAINNSFRFLKTHFFPPSPHGVCEHGEVEQGEARRHPLRPGEPAPLGPHEDGEPEVALPDVGLPRGVEQVAKVVLLGVAGAGDEALDLITRKKIF